MLHKLSLSIQRVILGGLLPGCLTAILLMATPPAWAIAKGGEGDQAVQAHVAELITQLKAPSFQQRRSAQWALQQLGLEAFEQLRDAASSHPSIEVSNAARYIIDSQRITWFLESDSLEVRSILNDFDSLSETQRVLRIDMLAKRGTTDALLALCRLARYERHERVSKEAALKLLDAITRGDASSSELIRSIGVAVGTGKRSSVRWIRQVLADRGSQPATADVEQWTQLAERELDWYRRQKQKDSESQKLVLDFFTRVCVWIRTRQDVATALEFVQPCLELVQGNSYHLQQFTIIVLDDLQTPQLVTELYETNRKAFRKDANLMYLLAESFLKSGDESQAEAVAQQASEQIGDPPEQIKTLSRRNNLDPAELEANNRRTTADRLAHRGLYAWAETEYLKAIAKGSQQSDQIRSELADFYWFGADYQKAADILQPVAKTIEAELHETHQQQESNALEQLLSSQKKRRLSTYYFYRGLAQTEVGQRASARESLRQALEHHADNPDIIIAMHELVDDPSFTQYYQQRLEQMSDRYRQDVMRAEEKLARAATRDQRRTDEAMLAHYCNQLAWLLSMCQVHPQEAIRLSERSIELVEDEPIYLDTLARCYFSAGQTDKAVQTQRRAVELAPFERQMLAQLQEFESAL